MRSIMANGGKFYIVMELMDQDLWGSLSLSLETYLKTYLTHIVS